MLTKGRYVFDNNHILEKSYDLLCAIFANKEIARRSDPANEQAPLGMLEKKFFETKVTRLLIEIAASLRIMGDQMYKLHDNDGEKKAYYTRIAEIDNYDFGLFDDLNLDFRETCNKIIHSDIFEFHFREGTEGHETDIAYLAGFQDKEVDWKHLNGYVRLSGKKFKDVWIVLLDIEVFISAVVKLLIK
jgi:hypothetical protein